MPASPGDATKRGAEPAGGRGGAFVTGGTRGIGFAIACRLAREGYQVTVCGATEESVDVCRRTAVAERLAIEARCIDVCDAAALRQGIDEAAARQGSLDLLVACAGRPTVGSALTLTVEDWDRCLALNLRGSFLAAQAALPHMIAGGGGAIVLISSIWALTAARDRVAYTTAKTALVGLMRGLAVDHAGQNVRVNCVAPGYVETDLLRLSVARANPGQEVDAVLAGIRTEHPLGRMVSPEDIAAAVLFLAGEGGQSITGQTLVVDGGIVTRFVSPGL